LDNKERDMFYTNFGYSSNMPYQGMPMMMPNQMNPNMVYSGNPNMIYNQNNLDIESKLNKLEKQINRLEIRVNRLENPYGNNTNIYNEPDSNMYML